MMKKYEEPTIKTIRFGTTESLASDIEQKMSGLPENTQGVEEW